MIHFRESSEGQLSSELAGRAFLFALQVLIETKPDVDRMRQQLAFDMPHFGPGAALDHGRPIWKSGEGEPPFLVGPSVVTACRLSDEAGVGELVLSHRTYQGVLAAFPILSEFAETKKIAKKEAAGVVWRCEAAKLKGLLS